ncbi:hypothetical protein, partial [Dorea formicigenerans]
LQKCGRGFLYPCLKFKRLHYELEKGEYLVNQKLNAYKKMVGTPVDLPQEFFRINRDIWQALTIKVGASFLTFSKSS